MAAESGTARNSGEQPARQQRPQQRSLVETAELKADFGAKQTVDHTPQPDGAAGSAPVASVEPVDLPKNMGRYRVQSRLGHGGMGSVFLAQDTQLDRLVALKVPRLAVDSTGTMVERFTREARAAALLSHPNICPIFDVGECDGVHFIAMGYIEGRPLTAYLATGKPQPERPAAMIVRKVALALDEAHSRGIVHRDLKPANIMIDRRGEPIVMDFGLACRTEDTSTRLTQDGVLLGTPAYMSPEQIDYRVAIGPAADVYSLGVVLYELLTGRCPFDGNVVSVIGQVLHAEPKPVSQLRPDASPPLAEICSKAMAKDPQQRYASMKDFALALTSFLKGDAAGDTSAALRVAQAQPLPDLDRLDEPLTSSLPAANVPQFASQSAPQFPTATRSPWTATTPRRRRKPWAIVAAALGALTVGDGLVAYLMSGGSTNSGNQQTKPIAAAGSTQADRKPAAAPQPFSEDPSSEAVQPASGGDHAPAPAVNQKPVAPTIAPGTTPNPPVSPAPMTPINQTGMPANPPGGPPPIMPVTTTPGLLTPAIPSAPPAMGTASPGAVANPLKPEIKIESTPMTPPSKPAPAPLLGFPPGEQPPAPPGSALTKDDIQKQFEEADHNHDGKLDATEVPMHIILRADKNHDHKLTLAEVQTAYDKLGAKLFDPPTEAEMRKIAGMRPPRPRGGFQGGPPGQNGAPGGPGGPNGGPGGGRGGRPPGRSAHH